jgi:hypothetical protein
MENKIRSAGLSSMGEPGNNLAEQIMNGWDLSARLVLQSQIIN